MNYKFYPSDYCCNSYVITASNGDAAIIDVGYEGTDGYNAALALGSRLKYILLTHRHSDHIHSAAELAGLTGAKIAISEADAVGLTDPDASLFGLVSAWRFSSQTPINADILLADGDIIEFDDVRLRVMATSGHTVGSVCFVGDGVIFSGDTLFKSGMGRVDFPTGDIGQMANSLIRLCELQGDYAVCAGHGEMTDLQTERDSNMYIRMAQNGTLHG